MMEIFSFHLADCGRLASLGALVRPPNASIVAGLRHAECMVPMTLGSPVLLPTRYHPGQLAMFARWQGESAIDDFLASTGIGSRLAAGWHVRMEFVRRWGRISALVDLPLEVGNHDEMRPVIAVTLARLRLSQTLRFIRWGKPVEQQVRDNPATTLALAATRPLRTLSTFSIWKTQKAMTDMVHGLGDGELAQRHVRAMEERNRRDFHHEFTTLRFRPLSEHGQWRGQTRYLP